MGSFPYHSHIFRDSYGSGMGLASHCWGVPENPIENGARDFTIAQVGRVF